MTTLPDALAEVLPPLPEPAWPSPVSRQPYYTTDQMHGYARAAIQAMADDARRRDAALRQCLQAMDIARDTIQPITEVQLKLHRLDPLTADKLDAAAKAAIDALNPIAKGE